jgi:hypothetical protein
LQMTLTGVSFIQGREAHCFLRHPWPIDFDVTGTIFSNKRCFFLAMRV